MRKFDSVNQSLRKINDRLSNGTAALYDSVAKKYSEQNLQQFRYHVSDAKGYLQDLKWRFKIACGDSTGSDMATESEDDISVTNKFFFSRDAPGKNLPAQLKAVQDVFYQHTDDLLLTEQVASLTQVPPSNQKGGFLKAYFYNAPPVAVLTMLSKFENDINNIENRILQEYLRK